MSRLGWICVVSMLLFACQQGNEAPQSAETGSPPVAAAATPEASSPPQATPAPPAVSPTPGALPKNPSKGKIGFTGAAGQNEKSGPPLDPFPEPEHASFETLRVEGVRFLLPIKEKKDPNQKLTEPNQVLEVFLLARLENRSILFPPAGKKKLFPQEAKGWQEALVGLPIGKTIRLEVSPELVKADETLNSRAKDQKVYIDVSILSAEKVNKENVQQVVKDPWI